ncbi:MAG: hypothetical protein ACI8PT_002348 [Gammaproteobacteria bacterium]|jgi:hypothetical protein
MHGLAVEDLGLDDLTGQDLTGTDCQVNSIESVSVR